MPLHLSKNESTWRFLHVGSALVPSSLLLFPQALKIRARSGQASSAPRGKAGLRVRSAEAVRKRRL